MIDLRKILLGNNSPSHPTSPSAEDLQTPTELPTVILTTPTRRTSLPSRTTSAGAPPSQPGGPSETPPPTCILPIICTPRPSDPIEPGPQDSPAPKLTPTG